MKAVYTAHFLYIKSQREKFKKLDTLNNCSADGIHPATMKFEKNKIQKIF